MLKISSYKHWLVPGRYFLDIDGLGVGLDENEWQDLLELVLPDPGDRLAYKAGTISHRAQKSIHRKICQHLRNIARADLDAFNRLYVFRTASGKPALPLLLTMLEGYAWRTGLAQLSAGNKIGSSITRESSLLELLGENAICIETFPRPTLWPSKTTSSSQIWIDAKSIRSVAGTIDNFSLITNSMSIRFKENSVIVTGASSASPQRKRKEHMELLDELTFIIERIASNTLGEAKFELKRLIENISKGKFAISDQDAVANELTLALTRLRSHKTEHCATDLARIRRQLWKMLEDQ